MAFRGAEKLPTSSAAAAAAADYDKPLPIQSDPVSVASAFASSGPSKRGFLRRKRDARPRYGMPRTPD